MRPSVGNSKGNDHDVRAVGTKAKRSGTATSGMNAEYQRLEAEASEVQNQIDELVKSSGQMVAVTQAKSQPKGVSLVHGAPASQGSRASQFSEGGRSLLAVRSRAGALERGWRGHSAAKRR